MKIRYLLFHIFLLLPTKSAFACDACGCSNSGSYFGLMPQSNKSLIGIRYQRLNFVTEIYGRFFPIKRVQVMAFLPYRFAQQITTSDTKRQNGISDATVLVNYNVINTFMDTESTSRFSHTLLLGGGVKLPTGKFRYDENKLTEVANENFQSGTGSTDFVLNAFYTIKKDQWGLAMNASRKFNTTNADHYRFGNQLFGTIDLYRSFSLGKMSVTPNIGIYGEKSDLGTRDGKKVLETGGTLLSGVAGVTLFANRWTLGISAQKPLAQNLSAGFVQARSRGMVQIGWLF